MNSFLLLLDFLLFFLFLSASALASANALHNANRVPTNIFQLFLSFLTNCLFFGDKMAGCLTIFLFYSGCFIDIFLEAKSEPYLFPRTAWAPCRRNILPG